MKKIATTVRCIPRYGYEHAQVRTVELDLPEYISEAALHDRMEQWFAHRGIADAVFAIETDDNGPFAIINDEAFTTDWGRPLL